ncbi:hypothetical protein BsWGS_25235 [Bradybaena similaris]
MVYRWILKYILTNEKVIKKIADSFVVKTAARITAYYLHRGKEVGRKKIKYLTKSIEPKETDSSTSKSEKPVKPEKILKKFSEAFKEQWKQEELKRQKKKMEKKAKKLTEGKE